MDGEGDADEDEEGAGGNKGLAFPSAAGGNKSFVPPYQADAVRSVSREMKRRLLLCIENDTDYFLLTGSDPADEFGCCPSTEVGEANQLVRDGILASLPQSLPPDACPVTVYAFREELVDSGNSFQRNCELRNSVREQLQSPSPMAKIILQWALCAFILVSTAIAIGKALEKPAESPLSSYQILGLEKPTVTVVCLMRSSTRCPFCLNMEQHTQAALSQYFADELADSRVIFVNVNTEDPQYQALQNRFDLFTSTIVLLEFKDGKELRAKQLPSLWQLTDKKAEFMEAIRRELQVFMEAHD